MTIYVQSRGKSQDYDYCWLEVRRDSQRLETPPELEKVQPEELIDSQNPSIVLARSGKYLVLLITTLRAGDERLDFMGRQIYNSVAWVEEDLPNKEKQLREIAIQALDKKLADIVKEAVESNADSAYGFRADFDKLKKLGGLSSQEERSLPRALSQRHAGKDSKYLRDNLIKELTEYSLPELSGNIQILVVITTMKSLNGLKSKKVWRGLSSRIESEEWENIGDSEIEVIEGKNSRKKLAGVIAIVLTGLITVVWLLVNHPTPQDMQPESIVPGQLSIVKVAHKSFKTF